MSEAPRAPGAVGFKHICDWCSQIVDVRSDGEIFRYVAHDMPKTSLFNGLPCPRNDLRWEPT